MSNIFLLDESGDIHVHLRENIHEQERTACEKDNHLRYIGLRGSNPLATLNTDRDNSFESPLHSKWVLSQNADAELVRTPYTLLEETSRTRCHDSFENRIRQIFHAHGNVHRLEATQIRDHQKHPHRFLDSVFEYRCKGAVDDGKDVRGMVVEDVSSFSSCRAYAMESKLPAWRFTHEDACVVASDEPTHGCWFHRREAAERTTTETANPCPANFPHLTNWPHHKKKICYNNASYAQPGTKNPGSQTWCCLDSSCKGMRNKC